MLFPLPYFSSPPCSRLANLPSLNFGVILSLHVVGMAEGGHTHNFAYPLGCCLYCKHSEAMLLLPLYFLFRIYKLQHEGRAFKDVASMFAALSKEMLRMTQMSTTDWLTENGFSPLTIDELVMSVVQCNYGQTPAMHALVGELPKT